MRQKKYASAVPKIWDWDLIFGCAVKAIFLLGSVVRGMECAIRAVKCKRFTKLLTLLQPYFFKI